MNDVAVLVEGQTELAFVRQIIAPHLALHSVYAWGRLPGRRVRRGGVPSWESVCGDIVRTLREWEGRFCTTMFDFYGMPTAWPGRKEASRLSYPENARHVEQAMAEAVSAQMGSAFRPERFIPYVQMHEYEALLFSDTVVLGNLLAGLPNCLAARPAEKLAAIVTEAGSPEQIDDSPETAPSKRIATLAIGYQKPLHGVIGTQRIGLQAIREACPHFADWLGRLESLGSD